MEVNCLIMMRKKKKKDLDFYAVIRSCIKVTHFGIIEVH